MSSPRVGKQFLEALIKQKLDDGTPAIFDAAVLSGLQNIEASPGKVTCTLVASPELQNRFGTMHGGCIATIVDTVGTAAIATQSSKVGVSLNINVDYYAPMPGLKECTILAQLLQFGEQVVKVGRTIATSYVEVRQKETGLLVATGRHMKFISDKPEQYVQHQNVKQRSRL